MKVLDLEGLGYFWTKIKNKFYIKPDTGIPKSDLSSEVQGSLNKADTALLTETDPIFTASPAHGISSEDIIYWDNKLEKLSAVKIIGSMYRTNVSGSGSISIQGNVGLFPVVLEAGTYTVVTDMLSNTNSYGLSVNCGGNTYTLNTTDGHIHDSREITIPANGRWSGTVIGSVAGNSMISVKIEKVADEVTEIALVGITNDYNDLDNKPILTNYFDGAVYDSNTKRINFKNGNVVKAYIDATAFIKDGMVDNVEIEDGKLIITFNTESGKEPIELDITAIFDPSNYYDKSTIDDFLDDKANVADLATVATSGEYSDLINPPTNVSDFTNDAGYLTEHQSLSNYYTKSETDDLLDDKADISDLATVATSGDYNDLTNKPTIPSAQVNSDWNATSGVAQILNKPDIPNVSQVVDTGTSITVGSTSYNVVSTYSPSGNADTYTAPSWSAMSNAYSELNFRTHVDDTSIGVNADDELYVKSLSADRLTNGTNNKVFTASELTKLTGIAAGAEVNVLSDWNETNTSSDAYIRNKPDIIQDQIRDLWINGHNIDIQSEYGIYLSGNEGISINGTLLDLNAQGNHINFSDGGDDDQLSIYGTEGIYLETPNNKKVYYNNQEIATKNDIPTSYAGSATKGGVAYKTEAIPFGVVDSTSTSTAFTATVPGITELTDGTCVLLKNGVVTSASGFTININGLGAHYAFNNMTEATAETTIFNINYTMLFVYDSTRVVGDITGAWCCYRGYDANTNTIGYQLRSNSYTKAMAAITYRYRILFSSADNSEWVPSNTSTSTNATASRTVCQTPINPFGEIVYYGTTASVAAGSRPAAANLWQQYTLALGYSFNNTGAALTLTSWKPVYVKCAPQANGSAIIDSTTPYVQSLPSTDDGKIYIFLGVAYSATNIELLMNHPVFYYKNGAIRVWVNSEQFDDSNLVHKTGDETIFQKKTIGASGEICLQSGWHQIYNEDDEETLEEALNVRNNVQADWNQTTTTAADYIKNKPYIKSKRGGEPETMVTKIGLLETDDWDHRVEINSNYFRVYTNYNGTNYNGHFLYNNKEVAVKDDIPTNVSAFTNDAGYLTSYTETDPTVPAWAKASTKPTYTAAEVGALPDTTVIPDAPGTLNTNNSTAQTVSSSESLSGTINLHKISKTGNYNDLLNKPTIPAVDTALTNSEIDTIWNNVMN